MLVKRSSKNQIAIPKAILKRAGLGPNDRYFDVVYSAGRIILKPMELEEKIPPEALARFKAKVLKEARGEKRFSSVEELIRHLKQKR